MFFDFNLLIELIKKENKAPLKNILLSETYSLFKERKDCINFVQMININQNDIMLMIEEIINISLENIKAKKIVFILDGYSFQYDPKNKLKDLIQKVSDIKKIFIEVIYDIKNLNDSEILYQNLNPENRLNYDTSNCNKYSCYTKLKIFSEIKKIF